MILIRGSVYFHEVHHFYPLTAIVGGFFFTSVLLLLYMIFIFRAPSHSIKKRFKLILLFLFLYCGYALLYVSGRNVKSETIVKEFSSLHPVLRLGVSTILLLDQDLIITDANRTREDYRRMGLATKAQSLHYPQKNGYTHALDIRTNGRSIFRNFFLKWYFRLMGFRVLRHSGTGDHLHISLKSHDRPYAY
jgi:hypothetical protein